MKNEITEERRKARLIASSFDTIKVLAMLKEKLPDVWELAELVGEWVWIEFPDKPSEQVREMLLDMGFHWNAKRVCWQHACGHYSRHTSGNPRWKYMTAPVKELNLEAQPA